MQHNLMGGWPAVSVLMLEKWNMSALTTNGVLGSRKRSIFDVYIPQRIGRRPSEYPRLAQTTALNQSPLYEAGVTSAGFESFLELPAEQQKRIALVGEMGCGKTTLMQKLAYEISEERTGTSIWIDLKDLSAGEPLEHYLLNRWLQQAMSTRKISEEMKDSLAEEFCQGKVWLFLDGLDEVVKASVTLAVVMADLGRQLTGWVGCANVVLGCRSNLWDGDKNHLRSQFDVYRPLSLAYPEEVELLMGRWLGHSPKRLEQGRRLLKLSPYFSDLLQNPLRLAVVCQLIEARFAGTPLGALEEDAIARMIAIHYDWRSRIPSFVIPPTVKTELIKKLKEVASNAVTGSNSYFRLKEKFLETHLGSPDLVGSLFWWALRLGWLNFIGFCLAEEKDPDYKVYAFSHPVLQRYFIR